jgi:acetoin utilization deacetylase AcuC-like enzyme
MSAFGMPGGPGRSARSGQDCANSCLHAGRGLASGAMARPLFFHHPLYQADLQGHVFPMEKYGLVHRALLDGGDTTPDDWRKPEPASAAELALVHTPEYLDDFLNHRWTRRTALSELPLDANVVSAFVLFTGGTIAAAREAMSRGFAVNVGGGFHHAFADHAEGFCYLNDLAVAIRVMQQEGAIRRAAVIDCDLHQGNGTARIFAGDDDVFTFSIHQERLYPVKQRSDLDIGLDDAAGDATYLAALDRALPRVFEHGRPELVLYQAGADPYEDDQLGNLGITMAGLRERDRRVLAACAERGVPCAVTFGGGYARKVADTVAIHAGTCRETLAAAGVRA